MKRLLLASLLAVVATTRSPALDLATASIADLQSAMAKGTLTSEKITELGSSFRRGASVVLRWGLRQSSLRRPRRQ